MCPIGKIIARKRGSGWILRFRFGMALSILSQGTALVAHHFVDDFKLAGPEENIATGWDLLRQRIDIGPSSRIGMYLGCNIIKQHITLKNGTKANAVIYDMESFLEQCVDKYIQLAGSDIVLKPAKTPFLPSSGSDSVYRRMSDSSKI